MIKNDEFVQVDVDELREIIERRDMKRFENVMKAFGIQKGLWKDDALCEEASNLAKICLSMASVLARASALEEDFVQLLIEYFAFSTNIFAFMVPASVFLSATKFDIGKSTAILDEFIDAVESDEFDEDWATYIENSSSAEFYQIINFLLSGEIESLNADWGLPILKRFYQLLPKDMLLALMSLSTKTFSNPLAGLFVGLAGL